MKLSEILIPSGYFHSHHRCIRAYRALRNTGRFNNYYLNFPEKPFTEERDDAEFMLLKIIPDLLKIKNIGRVLKLTIIQKLSEALIKHESIKP
tara:strand:+ start:3501 stop:3779 length:279 start_codon:yes stop_codon:yes gene_type:complete